MNDLKDEIKRKVKEWVDFADSDLAYAQHGLTLTEGNPYRHVAFNAQQCAEKYLKAYLIYRKIDFPYTHDISVLLKLCEETAIWVTEISNAKILTSYAATLRYPGVDSVVTKEEAINAIDIAVKVRGIVRNALITEGFDL